MELVIEERGKSFGKAHQARVDEIRRQLKNQARREDRDALLALADALLVYSHSQNLLKLPKRDLLEFFNALLDFLRRRDELVKLSFIDTAHSGISYLLVNTPDVPYLVDSMKTVLLRQSLRAQVVSHPILAVRRRKGVMISLGEEGEEVPRESLILVQFEGDEVDRSSLEQEVRRVFGVAQQAGGCRGALAAKLAALAEMSDHPMQKDFIDWLRNGNFICFGYAAVDLSAGSGRSLKARLLDEPVGWLPGALIPAQKVDDGLLPLTATTRKLFKRKKPLVVEVLDEVSPLYQRDNLVYIGLRDATADAGKVEHLLVGLFSQNSVNELACNVPPLREKLNAVLKRQHVHAESYDFRKVVEIFNTFPKAEMFFLEDAELDRLMQSFINLQREQSVKLVITRSLSLQGITLLAIMPRDFYSRDAVRRIESYLGRFLDAEQVSSRAVQLYSDYVSLHVRLVLRVNQVKIDIDTLQKVLSDLARPWEEKLRLLLLRGEEKCSGALLWRRYATVFPHDYKDLIHPRFAARDVRAIERLLDSGEERFDLWGPFQERQEFYRLQFYSLQESYLNELMPFLENLALAVIDEVDFVIEVEQRTVYVKSFAVRVQQAEALALTGLRDKLLEILNGLRRGSIEDDYLNRLMVTTGLDWREIDVFRAYRNYYFQLGNPFTKRRVAFALLNNPKVSLLLYRYFEARFMPKPDWVDPLRREEEALMPIRLELVQAFDRIRDINEDRILRSLFNLIDSTIRTNFFLRRNDPDYFLSFKISSIGVIEMPLPRPMFETYVHSASMEGIHLRGGKVARGGIRWSDRPDDFRTEVLGLMKTQMTKNTLIVPVGSKGGFVVKTPFATREEGAELSRQAYITLMRGLLDLVDNRVAGRTESPPGLVVYDDADPYLVVAADKGTAHLPDTANGVSLEYGFWLGDAFASGGSVGYDHKKLGITARGAWECVKRHFRELGKDIQNEVFTVVGIGDMSGDVFGNGMLLSKQIRLLAAFNHLHIFLDPDPDPRRSWKERKRLFDKPRSNWSDYNPELISDGGGVWERSSKDVPLSPRVRKWLGVRHATMEGEELIRRLLTADVELLWNGGIGTYVKATQEKNADVGDRANDNVRVSASQLKARVVGEGGNLGLTQSARVEFAMNGGLINTDAVDNSAGVDTSDHEVNLKIFFQVLREDGTVKTVKTRNRLLHEVEDDVCDQVLANNYTQSLCLSLDLLRCREDGEPFIDLAERLVNAGLLDRQSESLPSRKELVARGQGYQRPELSILLAYSKMQIYQALLDSSLPDREAAQPFLHAYFPEMFRKRFGTRIKTHPLRREIVATMITNRVVDQAGCAFFNTLVRQSGASHIQALTAYLIFDEVLNGAEVRGRIAAADNRMPAARQYEILLALENALAGLCRQAIELGLPLTLDKECIRNYRVSLASFRGHLQELLPAAEWQSCQDVAAGLADEGFPEPMAMDQAGLNYLVGFLPAIHIATKTGADLMAVTSVMSEVRLRLQLPQLLENLGDYVPHDRWDRMAQAGLRGAFIKQAVRLSRAIVGDGRGTNGYLAEKRQNLDYYLGLMETLKGTPPVSTSPYMVLLRAIEAIAD